MRDVFLVHTHGTSPHGIDHWTKPYRTVSAAHGQATRHLTRPDGQRKAGDWVADIYRLGAGTDGRPTLTHLETR